MMRAMKKKFLKEILLTLSSLMISILGQKLSNNLARSGIQSKK